MDLQCSPTAPKKIWNILKLAFFIMRNGLVPKRKLMLDISLVMKRGKLLGKSLGSLMFHHLHHHHHHHQQSGSSAAAPDDHVYGPDEYEFSCSNTPVPVLFPAKRKYSYFPCISAPPVDEQDKIPKSVMTMLPRIEYSPQCAYSLSGLAPGERQTPIPSPFSVRVSNYSRAEEGEGSSTGEVDHEAEEFIKRFYQRLQVQGVLEDQEKECYKTLARGI